MAKGLMRAIAATIWVYSYVTLGAIAAVAAVPGFFVARWGWAQDGAFAGPVAPFMDVFLGLYFSFLGYIVFGLSLMAILPILRIVLRFKPHVGELPVFSFRVWPWYNYNGMIFLFNTVFGRVARLSHVYAWYLRGMGAKIGRNVVFNTQHAYDLDLLEVGDNTVIGANASILGHVGEKGKLVRQPVRIGKNCTVGQYTNIFPGATLGDNCHVGAMSLVPKGSTLDANAVYGGVPVRKIRDLAPGEKVTSSDVSATTGSPRA